MTVTAAGTEPKEIKSSGNKEDLPKASKLSLERASSIGWFFIESYYELYNKDPETLYKLYNNEASLTHGEIPEISKSVSQASGSKAVKQFFADLKSKATKNKIIVINADIQISLNTNILIVVNGEWSKNESTYCQFNQTFLLSKGVNDSNYDIANDVLRFINYNFKHENIVEKEPTSKEEDFTESDAVSDVAQDSTPDVAPESSNGEKVAEDSLTEAETTEQSANELEDQKKSNTPTPSTSEPTTVVASPVENVESSVSPSSSTVSSWAAAAAKAKDKQPVSVKQSPAASKPTTVPLVKKAVQPVTLPNGKFKKEDWFPIYVRGCENVEENEIKEHLTKTFGEIKFLKKNVNICLVDFLRGEGQRKALDAKKTVINDTTIFLEVRESKNTKKDPKVKEKFNDSKRKNDKKQVPKKK